MNSNYLSKFRSTRAYLLCVLLLLLLPLGASADNQFEIVILHTNDFHGNLLPYEDTDFLPPGETVGGAAYIATKVSEVRGKFPGKVILLDAGDIAQGPAISNMFEGKPVVEYMNYLQYDAMTIGNHEFDWGLQGLQKITNLAHFPVLCGNVVFEKTGDFLPNVKPYIIVEREGMKIGVIGVITEDTTRMSFPKNIEGLKFLEPFETVKKHIEELKEKGIKVILVLSHLGYGVDKDLARSVQGITAIIGGHSHLPLRATEKVNNTLIVQAGSCGAFLGKLRLILDKDTGEILFYNVENGLIPIIDSDIQPDIHMQNIIKPYVDKVKSLMDEVIGRAAKDILKTYFKGIVDTPLGNFITDVIREKYKADVAIYNLGGIRSSLYKGDITKGDVYRLIPFDNRIVTINLTGSQIVDMLNDFADKHIGIQVSGVSFLYSPNREKGEKISCVLINGKQVEPEKIYRLATLDFVYYTSDDSSVIKKGRDFTYGSISRDDIEDFIRKKKVITPPDDTRIKQEK